MPQLILSDRVAIFPQTTSLDGIVYSIVANDYNLTLRTNITAIHLPAAICAPVYTEDLQQLGFTDALDALITVNMRFFAVDTSVQDAIICHEIGHILYLQKKYPNLNLISAAELNQAMIELSGGPGSKEYMYGEKYADLFSLRHGGAEPLLEILKEHRRLTTKEYIHQIDDERSSNITKHL